MNIFKVSYKNKRTSSDEIYKGFGFRHLSDATQYYVHPNNQSFKGTTTLCQPIGEAISLFSELISALRKSDASIGNIYSDENADTVFLDIKIPQDWRKNNVVDKNLYRYNVLCFENEIKLAAYDSNDRWLDGSMEHLHPLYKLLAYFTGLLVREIKQNEEFCATVDRYLANPTAEAFVNIHEDFYQAHKADNYSLEYSDISMYDTSGLYSYLESYKVISVNKSLSENPPEIDIKRFSDSDLCEEYRMLIPSLAAEFTLPKKLNGVCSGIANGDITALLLHGPAGTGKTMACKLICREISLPVMETVNCTENLDEFILGKYIPLDDKIIFKESYVTKAIRYGGAVVFEEINFAKPQYLAFLNSLLDDNGFVRLDSGEVVRRHKNFRFFATMNLGYFGTKELNQALYNRFNGIVELAELSDEAITKMLVTRVPECTCVCDKILSVYHKLKKKIEAEELDLVISPRNLENWARLSKYEGYIIAAEKTIIPIAKCDRVFEDIIRSFIMLYKWE